MDKRSWTVLATDGFMFERLAMLLLTIVLVLVAGCGKDIITSARDGDVDRVIRLLDAGADPNAREPAYGWTPLHEAAQGPWFKVAKALIAHGADVNARDSDGETPLHVAGTPSIVQLLLAHHANKNAKDVEGRTPLHKIAGGGDIDAVTFLVQYGADVDARDSQGCTPLHNAANGGHVDVARFLLRHGADINAKDTEGWTPLRYAKRSKNLELIHILQARGGR